MERLARFGKGAWLAGKRGRGRAAHRPTDAAGSDASLMKKADSAKMRKTTPPTSVTAIGELLIFSFRNSKF